MYSEKINLPIVQNGKSISLKVNGKTETYTPIDKYRSPHLQLPTVIAKAITKYSTTNSPNITEEELFKFKKDITVGTIEIKNLFNGDLTTNATFKDAWLSSCEKLIDLYTDEKSIGGKEITPSEYTELLHTMLNSGLGLRKENY